MDNLIHKQLEEKFKDLNFSFHDITLFLQDGTSMLKLSEKSTKKPYTCRLSLDLKTLQVLCTTFKGTKQCTDYSLYDCSLNALIVDVSQIRELRFGQNTRGFEIHGKKVEHEERAFTIIYSTLTGYKMLELGSLSNYHY